LNDSHQVRSRSLYPFSTYNHFTADTLHRAVTLTFDPLTVNAFTVSAVTFSNSVPIFNKIC